jgi:hypothetical protein
VLGLRALLQRGDGEAVAKVRKEIALRARTSRARVLKEMQELLSAWDRKYGAKKSETSPPARPAGVVARQSRGAGAGRA